MRNASGPRKEVFRTSEYEIHVVGGGRAGWHDLYHAMLRMRWWAAIAIIVGAYVGLNLVFGLLYMWSGGIVNARPGSYADAFNFSVETMGTIGYGNMYPTGALANALVTAESVLGMLATALATGLVFVRFSRVRPRLRFSTMAAIGPMDGVPTLMIRVGNQRRNQIVDARFRATVMRTTRTAEGVTIYRAEDLQLVRGRAPALARSWNVMHRIDAGSPLHGDSPDTFLRGEIEITVDVVGVDDTSLQPVHAQYTWFSRSVVWGARLADVLSETPEGNMLLDLRRFDEVAATDPTDGFPYRYAEAGDPVARPA